MLLLALDVLQIQDRIWGNRSSWTRKSCLGQIKNHHSGFVDMGYDGVAMQRTPTTSNIPAPIIAGRWQVGGQQEARCRGQTLHQRLIFLNKCQSTISFSRNMDWHQEKQCAPSTWLAFSFHTFGSQKPQDGARELEMSQQLPK
jgi:hypothetical protein